MYHFSDEENDEYFETLNEVGFQKSDYEWNNQYLEIREIKDAFQKYSKMKDLLEKFEFYCKKFCKLFIDEKEMMNNVKINSSGGTKIFII